MRGTRFGILATALSFFICSMLGGLAGPGLVAAASSLSFTAIAGPGGTCNSGTPPGFCNDVGMDYSQLTGNLVTSLFPPPSSPGTLLSNVNRISGIHSPIDGGGSTPEEVKVATARLAPACQNFPVGTMFSSTGSKGVMQIVAPNGTLVASFLLTGPSVTLAGTVTENGDLRGGFFVDRFCAGGTLVLGGVTVGTPGDVFVVSGDGQPHGVLGGNAWRVHPDATETNW